MKIFSKLPLNRFNTGSLWVVNDKSEIIFGPVRARGEVDNDAAKKANNEEENPELPYGDHPYGVYRVVKPVRIADAKEHQDKYGPFFIPVNPVSGEAMRARQNGRSGFGIHGGKLHKDGRLRETLGCLRIDNEASVELTKLISDEINSGRDVFYECQQEEVTA